MESPNHSAPSSPTSHSSRDREGMIQPALRFLHAPVTSLLEYSGILRLRPPDHESESLIPHLSGGSNSGSDPSRNGSVSSNSIGEVSIRIQEHERGDDSSSGGGSTAVGDESSEVGDRAGSGSGETSLSVGLGEGDVGGGTSGTGNGDSSSSQQQRYDLQQVSRWIEQILPFSLLLFGVFIRQHFQGFFVTIYITVIMVKSNDILRKQTALKGERKIYVLIGYAIAFMLHVIGVYWWYQNDDLCYPLFMVPPKAIPPFLHALFIIVVNDAMVRQAAMAFKLILLIYYRNGRGHNFRRQGQMLTLIEYGLILYRALLPAPVWYRFFLNKEYGSLFSSLITGLYLTFKLTSVVEKIGSFYASLKVLSRKEVHYGSHATPEQVNEAGDLCAICQEKMEAPILLRCKHIFCEDCVSEWFDRERTCPLCRALVRPADLRSFGDGSTSLLFQLC